jgi:hypothetical protein
MFPAPPPEAFGQFEVIVVVPDLCDLEPQGVSTSSSVLFAAYLDDNVSSGGEGESLPSGLP